MMHAGQYGNAGAYFSTGTSNQATLYMLGIVGNFAGKRPVSAYSVVRMVGNTNLSVANRIGSPSAAVIGWCGLRPVAFPLVTGWNFDTPLT
jgi:hypothetical protein